MLIEQAKGLGPNRHAVKKSELPKEESKGILKRKDELLYSLSVAGFVLVTASLVIFILIKYIGRRQVEAIARDTDDSNFDYEIQN